MKKLLNPDYVIENLFRFEPAAKYIAALHF
ncbi:hypothetical protein SAMN06265376_101298 [Dokdonia pacifica]|uniref:Uncharacterized protein n=1 Tax=Dokdonia pacifica TaxID=1627892 RepID=A0A238VSA9_9FLAO|nr:hypothetical protein SAMN06265376_101298 [Dokdonia pacifica]